jgi:putative SOS response-associated peptidase YedK
MCYTVKIDLTREVLERQFGAKLENEEMYTPGDRINAFSLPRLPVICNNNASEINVFTWGLIPFWVKDAEKAKEIRMKTFNARCESLAEKPSFRNAFSQKRCLVLVNGFYEWQTNEKRKIPFFIGLADNSAFALAGLYDNWKNPLTGESVNTFTIVTTRANPMLEVIHNTKKRMPVILAKEDQKVWLDINTDPVVYGLFEPFPQEMMYSEQIIN